MLIGLFMIFCLAQYKRIVSLTNPTISVSFQGPTMQKTNVMRAESNTQTCSEIYHDEILIQFVV